MLQRNNDKHGTSRLIKILAIAATAVAVASSAIVGTVAAQSSRLFDDVPRGHYAYDAIEWAVDNRITVGCGDGTNFCPEQTLNRAHMVTFLKRYHDKFHRSSSTGSTGSNDDGLYFTLEGTGSRTNRSVRLTTGRYIVDFDVEYDSTDLGRLELIASDEDDATVTLVDEADVRHTDYRKSVTLRIGSGSGALDPGRIWFEVDTLARAEWTITVTEL